MENKEEYAEQFDKERRKFEAFLKKETSDIFSKEKDDISDMEDEEEIYNVIEDEEKWNLLFIPFYLDLVKAFGDDVKNNILGTEDEEITITDEIKENINKKASDSAKSIITTSKDNIAAIFDKAKEENIDVKESIKELYDQQYIDGGRSELIAAVETVWASNYASVEAINDVDDGKTKKIWIPILDDKTRETHAEAANHPPISLDESFDIGGSLLEYPGDPSGPPEEIMNCRCVLGYVTEEDGKKDIDRTITIIKRNNEL